MAQKTVERGEIVTLPVESVRVLMAAAAEFKGGKLVPYVALATFCAIRPDELARLSWEQIDLGEKQVTITASAAKKRVGGWWTCRRIALRGWRLMPGPKLQSRA